MPAERLSMRKVREVLRLKYACRVSERVIARSLGVGRTAIGEYIRRAAVVGITWPIPVELDDTALERKLFAPAGYNPPSSKPLPDWNRIHAARNRAIRRPAHRDAIQSCTAWSGECRASRLDRHARTERSASAGIRNPSQ